MLVVKNLPANAGNTDSIPGTRRTPGGGNGNPLQYSCLVNSIDKRSLVGYSPWDCKVSDMTELLTTHTHTPSQKHMERWDAGPWPSRVGYWDVLDSTCLLPCIGCYWGPSAGSSGAFTSLTMSKTWEGSSYLSFCCLCPELPHEWLGGPDGGEPGRCGITKATPLEPGQREVDLLRGWHAMGRGGLCLAWLKGLFLWIWVVSHIDLWCRRILIHQMGLLRIYSFVGCCLHFCFCAF